MNYLHVLQPKVFRLVMICAVLLLPVMVCAQSQSGALEVNGGWSATGSVSCYGLVHQLNHCTRFDTRQSCILRCAQAEGYFVLLADNKTYRLVGADAMLKRFAGDQVTISGVAKQGALEVTAVAKAH
jgi:hypothetical protein